MRKVLLGLSMLVLTSLSFSSLAQPGLHATGVVINPMDQAKVIAAFQVWMDGYGKKSKNRILLQSHVADGANPATHSFVAMFSSVAENEEFSNMVQEEGMEEWMAFLEKVTPVSSVVSSSRSTVIRSYGDISDDNDVWIVHALTAGNAPSVVQAMDAWMNSPTGKKFPGELHLMGTVAGGIGAPSHLVAIGFESQAQMAEWNEVAAPSADLGRLLSSLNALTEYHGANMLMTIGAWGKSAKSIFK